MYKSVLGFGSDRRLSLRRRYGGRAAATFRLKDGTPVLCSILDVGDSGFALTIPQRFGSRTQVDDVVEEFQVLYEGQAVLKVPWARVKNAISLQSPENDKITRIGVSIEERLEIEEFDNGETFRGEEAHQAIERLVKRKGYLRIESDGAAISTQPCFLVSENGKHSLLLCRMNGRSVTKKADDTVKISFELMGQLLEGDVIISDQSRSAMQLLLPEKLTVRNRRQCTRLSSQTAGISLRIRSPFTDEWSTHEVIDISANGLSFSGSREDCLVRGTIFREANLVGPNGLVCSVEGTITSCIVESNTDNAGGGVRYGASLVAFPEVAKRWLMDLVAGVEQNPAATFKELTQLFTEARYTFHPDYGFDRSDDLYVLGHAYGHLMAARGSLGVSIPVRAEGDLVGHISGLRIYPKTWLVQHLAVKPGYHRSTQISPQLGEKIVDVMESLDDVEYMKFTWNTMNRWPNRIFNRVADEIKGSGPILLTHFHYMKLQEWQRLPDRRDSNIRKATAAEVRRIASNLSSRSDIAADSQSLSVSEMRLSGLSRAYNKYGLLRDRDIFVVDGQNGISAFAIVESCTPGMCMVETTNAFSLWDLDENCSRSNRMELAIYCANYYQAKGRRLPVCLASDQDVDLLSQVGFTKLAVFSDLTVHRSLWRKWQQSYAAVFDAL